MWENYMERVEKLLKSIDGYADIRLEHRALLTINMKNGIIENFNRILDVGGCIRVLLKNHGWGIATLNDLNSIDKAFTDAVDASRVLIPDEPIKIFEVDPLRATVAIEVVDPCENHSDEEKIDLVTQYNEIMRESGGNPLVLATTIYGEIRSKKLLMNTFGVSVDHDYQNVIFYASGQAKRYDDIQEARESISSRKSFIALKKIEDRVRNSAKRAVELLDAKSVEGGNYTVVLDPKLAGVFIHEAFGHLSEADFIIENPQAKELMYMGRKFGENFLNVFDDGSEVPELQGSIIYDDEGIACKKNYLIKDGKLIGRLHSLETAEKMAEKPTGNSRAQNYHFAPQVRMTNTGIENGPHSSKNIFDGIEKGIYAIDSYGGNTQLENFSFSAGCAYMIRDGKIAELVKDVVLQGNLFETMANIEQIGNDFMWAKWAGNCGKGGQTVPVDVGAPHIRIRNVTIGGK